MSFELTVIIPCFNEAVFIKECLESIVNQPAFNSHIIELLIINDGSEDNSLEVINDFVKSDHCIKVIDTAHNGLSMARNIGLSIATGKYVMFIDGDDWLASNSLTDILNLIKDGQSDVIIGLIEGIPEKGVQKSYKDPNPKDFQLDEKEKDFLVKMHLNGMKIGPSVKYIFKKTMVDAQQLFFAHLLHEDQLWSSLLLCHATSYKLYDNHFYRYRLKTDGLSMNNTLTVANDYLIMVKTMSEMAKQTSIEKTLFLCYRCLYLIDKIIMFSLSYTAEEKTFLERLFDNNKLVVSYCKEVIKNHHC